MKRLFLFILFCLSLSLLAGCSEMITLYTDAGKDAVTALVEPFTKSTGITVNVFNYGNVYALADSIAAYSAKDGKYMPVVPGALTQAGDVVFSTEMAMGEVLYSRDALLPFTPASADQTPIGAKREGYWYGSGGKGWVLAWNTKRLPGNPPSSLFDLASEAYPKGAVALINPNYILYYPCGACAIAGKDRLTAFFQTMIDRNTDWEAKPAQTAEAVAAGRAWVCLTTLAEAQQQIKLGAPLAWAVPDQRDGEIGAYLQYNVVGVVKTTAHAESAKKLAEYLMSAEAEALEVKLGISDATMRPGTSCAPVVRPLPTNLDAAKAAMSQDLAQTLVYFTIANPKYKGK